MIGARAAGTYGGILAVLAALLLVVGAYVLLEVLAHPLQGESGEIIGAAVLIALATIMTFYLLEPRISAKFRRRRHRIKERPQRFITLHLQLNPERRKTPFARAPGAFAGAVPKPAYEFTLKLAESPPNSVLREDGGDAVHGRR
jgi:hypothetical protein